MSLNLARALVARLKDDEAFRKAVRSTDSGRGLAAGPVRRLRLLRGGGLGSPRLLRLRRDRAGEPLGDFPGGESTVWLLEQQREGLRPGARGPRCAGAAACQHNPRATANLTAAPASAMARHAVSPPVYLDPGIGIRLDGPSHSRRRAQSDFTCPGRVQQREAQTAHIVDVDATFRELVQPLLLWPRRSCATAWTWATCSRTVRRPSPGSRGRGACRGSAWPRARVLRQLLVDEGDERVDEPGPRHKGVPRLEQAHHAAHDVGAARAAARTSDGASLGRPAPVGQSETSTLGVGASRWVRSTHARCWQRRSVNTVWPRMQLSLKTVRPWWNDARQGASWYTTSASPPRLLSSLLLRGFVMHRLMWGQSDSSSRSP